MNKEPHLDRYIGPYLGIARRVMEKRINKNFSTEGFDLTLHHMIVLTHLWKKDGQNQRTLCEYAGRNKTTITRTIDNLEKRNYVLRVPDTTDRRNKLIYLTHKGKEIQQKLMPIMKQSMEEATEGVDSQELEICKKVLRKVILNLADQGEILNFSQNSNK